ncbi:MAG: YfiR family protein [Lysobacterales bacterium]
MPSSYLTYFRPSCVGFAAFLALLFTTHVTGSETTPPSENTLKAALVYKIMAYVTWPESVFQHSPDDAFTLCEYGDHPLSGELYSLTKRTAAGRPIELIHLSEKESFDSTCHLLFVDSKSDVGVIIEQTGQHPVLTISDGKAFAQSGGMIEIRKNRNRFGFLINRTAAVDAGLLIAAPLLELSTVVRSK